MIVAGKTQSQADQSGSFSGNGLFSFNIIVDAFGIIIIIVSILKSQLLLYK